MTSAEKRKILEEAIDRGYEEIANTNGHGMSQESFSTLIENTRDLEWWAHKEKYEDDPYPYGAGTDSPAPEKPQNQMPDPEPAVDKQPQDPEPTETQEPVEEKPEPDGNDYKPQEVRAALASARLKGVNVAALIRKFGADNFAALPSDKYGSLMQAVEQELTNAS